MSTKQDSDQQNCLIERRMRERVAHQDAIEPKSVRPERIADYLISIANTYRRGTWQRYRSACIRTWELEQPIGYRTATERLRANTASVVRDATTRPSVWRTQKHKRLPEEDFQQLVTWLRTRRSSSTHATLTRTLLACGLVTGLRPGEWARAWLMETPDDPVLNPAPIPEREREGDWALGQAEQLAHRFEPEMEGGALILAVPTLKKQTSETSDARNIRYLDITLFERQMQKQIHELIMEMQRARLLGRENNHVSTCQRLLDRANRKLWPRRRRHYTLTSTRHEFATQARALFSNAEVAALMGHGTTGMSRRNYGGSDLAGAPYAPVRLPRADPNAVSAVIES